MSAMRKFPAEGSTGKNKKPDGAPANRRTGKGKPAEKTSAKGAGTYKLRETGNDAPRERRFLDNKPSGDRPYKSRKPYEGKSEGNDSPRPYKGSRDDKPSRPWKRDSGSDTPRERRFSDSKPSGDRPYRSRKPDDGKGGGTDSPRPYRGNRDDKPSGSWKREGDTETPRERRFSDSKPSGDRPYRSRKPEDGKKGSTDSPRPYRGSRDDKPSRPWKREGDTDTPRERRFSDSKPSGDRPYRSRKPEDGKEGSTDSPRPYRGSRDDKPSGPWKREGERETPRERRFSDSKPSGDRPYKSRKPEDGASDGNYKPKRKFQDTDEPRKFKSDDSRSLPRKPGSYDKDKFSGSYKPKESKSFADDGTIRLNKYIANSGICSRREADTLIESGAVMVNGEVVTELGTKVTRADKIQFGGETLNIEKKVYLLLNKPKGYITTVDDPQERNTVMMLIKDACRERVYPVGRLDRNTSGLLLFTNDGDMAKKLTHPGHKVRKVYHVELNKALSKNDMLKLSEGVELEDGLMAVDEIAYTGAGSDKKNIGVVIHSGKNRVVRRMFEALEYEVVKLDRVAFANLTKKDLPRGRWRFLDEKELNLLKMI